MKWYLCLIWLSIGSCVGFIICALLTINRIAELSHTIEGLREYIRYLMHEEIN